MSEEKRVYLSRLILHEDNPRFEGVLDEEKAINALCSTEKVLELARDIAENGLSPLERFMVFQEDQADAPDDANFVVAEGNRRLCALKLLKDPDRAPANIREALKKAAKNFDVPRTVPVVIENNEEERRKWIERAHAGPLDGKGRKAWNSTQKTRFFRETRNLRGQTLLDYAVERGFLSSEETTGRLSHLVRLLINPVMRATVGVHFAKEPTVLFRDRPLDDFDKMLTWLLEEARTKKLGSQATSEKIAAQANSLETELGCTGPRLAAPVALGEDISQVIDTSTAPKTSSSPTPSADVPAAQAINATTEDVTLESRPSSDQAQTEEQMSPDAGTPVAPQKPVRPKPSKDMPYSHNVADLLSKLGNYKLESLYYSVSAIPMREHIPALYVTAWSFLDSFSVVMGRPESATISQHWQAKNLKGNRYKLSQGRANACAEAVDRIRTLGNDTKHHPTAAGFNGEQLKNDWELILEVIEIDLRKHFQE